MQRIVIRGQGPGQLAAFNPPSQMVDTATDGGGFIFENQDSVAHRPTPDAGSGDWSDKVPDPANPGGPMILKPIEPGGTSVLITATSNGKFSYHCAIHPQEKGEIEAPRVITIQTELISANFNPHNLTLSPAKNDGCPADDAGLFVFLNLDQHTSHLPTPIQGPPWFAAPIAPGRYSAMSTITAQGKHAYKCALHPKETGVIELPPPPNKPAVVS